jgi:hypothetical protein
MMLSVLLPDVAFTPTSCGSTVVFPFDGLLSFPLGEAVKNLSVQHVALKFRWEE